MFIKPILCELGDFLEPVSVYESLRNEPYSSFLDSGMNYEKLGRFSFIGYDPFMVIESRGREIKALTQDGTEAFKGDPLVFLKSALSYYRTERAGGDIPFTSGCIGYFSYDLRYFIEELPFISVDDIRIPDLVMSFYDTAIIFDNLLKKTYISSSGLPYLESEKNRGRALARLEFIKARLKSAASRCFNPPSRNSPPVRVWMDSEGSFASADFCRSGKTDSAGVSPRSFNVEAEQAGLVSERTFPRGGVYSNFTRDGYKDAVLKAKQYIGEGDIYQVNLSQRMSCDFSGDSFELYKALRRINPAPFAAYLNYGDFQIVSASPERFIKLSAGGIQTRPIKGTRPRGADKEQDAKLKTELMSSTKDRAEHLMIVDLERNDIGRVCEYGSVRPEELIVVETYSTVHHLVSTISGKLRQGVDIVDCLRCCFPGGSITGAPKIRAMEIIEEIEPSKRGVYTGSIGYIDTSGDADLSIAIRTAVVKNGTAYFQAGGGIVADSDPDKEYEETMDKACAIIEAVRMEKNRAAAYV